MGLFSSIGKVVKNVVKGVSSVAGAISPVTDLIGGGLGYLGAQQANSATAASTKEQMEFQERMRGSAYQAAVADMKKAGLNPRLVYSQGGASAPAGASYSARDVSQGAREGMMASASMRNIIEQNNNLKAQSDAATASAASARAQAKKLEAETQGVQFENVGKGVDAQLAKDYGALVRSGAGNAINAARGAAGLARGVASVAKKGWSWVTPKNLIAPFRRK